MSVFSAGVQEREGPRDLRGREELQGLCQPAYGPRQCPSVRHPCQEGKGGCRAGCRKEEINVNLYGTVKKNKCIKKSFVFGVISWKTFMLCRLVWFVEDVGVMFGEMALDSQSQK